MVSQKMKLCDPQNVSACVVTTPGYSAVGEILSRPDSHKNVSDRVSQTVSVRALEDEEERRKTKGAFGFTAF